MCFSNVPRCSTFRTGCTIEINYEDILLNPGGACVSLRHPGHDDPGGENRRATLVIISFAWRPTSTGQRNASSRHYILIGPPFVPRSLSRRPLFLVMEIDLIDLSSPLKMESRAVEVTSRMHTRACSLLIVQRASAPLPERARLSKSCFPSQTLHPLPQLQVQRESSPM